MESKWYLFPGQTIENTKISDRAHALHITAPAWESITQHLYRKERIQNAIDKEKAHREALAQGSHSMTKDWINSIENIRLKKQDERYNRVDKRKEDKIQLFYKMREEQEVVRKEYVDKVKTQAFRAHGASRDLTSALILSETLYEREKQIEFQKKIKQHEQEVKKLADEQIMSGDDKEKKKEQEEKQKHLDFERKVASSLREQIKLNEETRKAAELARIERQTKDRINADIEEKLLKQFEIDEKMRKRREMAIDRKKALVAQRKRQEILAKEEAEMEKATEFYREAKDRIDCLKKIKEKEIMEEGVKRRALLFDKLAEIHEAKNAADDERYAKAEASIDPNVQAAIEAKAAFEVQAIKDKHEDKRQYLERLEKNKNIEEEMKRWELLNRCKTDEAMKEYDKKNLIDKWAKIDAYRNDLLEQIAETKDMQKREKEIDDIMSYVSFERDDKMFFEYADEVMKLAKSKNRSTYPIEKVIAEYKRTHNLMSKDRHCRCCRK